MKEIPKYIFYRIDRVYSHLNEPQIMRRLNKYNLGIKLLCSFKDYDNIYLVTSFFEGKTLYTFKEEIMSEEKIQFISACIIQSFIYFRKEEIIHRDIHLRNIILDKDNYFNIIDFSSAINNQDKNKKEYYIITYMNVSPPEILKHKNYYYNSDYYNFGSMIYYLIFKRYPNVIKKEQKLEQVTIDYREIKNYSQNCIDFINKLIINEPKERMGYIDINELKNHPWFNNINWDKLENKQISSPFNFKNDNNNINYKECDKINIRNVTIERYRGITKTSFYKKLIKRFEYSDISNCTLYLKY